MEIKTTIRQEKTVNVELPKFWKKVTDYKTQFLGAISDENVVMISVAKNYTSVGIWPLDSMKNEIVDAIYEGWEEITEEHFLAIHEETLQSLSLQPKLIEANDLPDQLFTQK